jgi:uncharacterized membrane protein
MTKIRSFVKGLVWETSIFVIATIITYWYFKQLKGAIKVSLILLVIKITLFYFHERMWKKIKWQKG